MKEKNKTLEEHGPPAFPSSFSFHPFPTVPSDLSCHRCGYNLRTLRADANCRAFPSNTPGTELVSTLVASAVYAGEWASLGALLAMLSYLQSLAATRLLDADLATRCAKVWAQLLGGGIVCLVLDLAARFVPLPSRQRGSYLISALANLYLLVAVIRYVGILFLFRGTLHRQLDLAREAWSAATKAAVSCVEAR